MSDDSEFWDECFRRHAWPTDPDPLLVRHAEPLPPGRALDMGSGPGRNSLWLARRGWTVTAVDVSAVALEQTAQNAANERLAVTTEYGDVATWAASGASYELVVLANLHLHQADLPAALDRLAAALVPGGHLFVVGHDIANLGRHGPQDPDLLLTVDRLSAALPQDLDVERVEQVMRTRDDQTSDHEDDVAVVAWATRPPAG
jgi:SAM-dependent methyltransferase